MKRLSVVGFSFLIVCSACFANLSCSASKLPHKTLTILTAKGKTVEVDAEIASSEEERNHGFMERRHIPDGTGMLFVFEEDQILRFWMKDTPTPLSIAYIDSAGTIRDIFAMTPYSLADITSTSSVRYALEVPRGWYTRKNISVGDKINLDSIK